MADCVSGVWGAALALPKNGQHPPTYSGVNILLLWDALFARSYERNFWLIFKQALALGGAVRKGETGTIAVYADSFIPKKEQQSNWIRFPDCRDKKPDDWIRGVTEQDRLRRILTFVCISVYDNVSYIWRYFIKTEWRDGMPSSRPYPVLVALIVAAMVLGARPTAAAVTVEQYHVHDFAFKAHVNGNPFDIDLRGEFTGPSGVRVTVPGFYDGDDTWKIRFSPSTPGNWTMRTISTVPALNNHAEDAITATANTDKAVHGRLLVDAFNPYHFVYEDGTRYFLMGYEADWLAEADMKDPNRTVMHHLIDQIAARGFNHVITNVFAYDTSWSKGNQNQWDYGPPAMYVFGGTNEHPDHAVLNTNYFKIYDDMIQALQDKGIVADIMLKVYNKGVNWPAPGSKEEERYYRYVTARYQAYSNVVWAFSKEEFNEPNKVLEKSLIERIRETDGYHHLTTTHTDGAFTWDPQLGSNVVDFDLDQEHGAYWPQKPAFERALRQRPYLNSELYYEIGVDDLPTYPPRNSWQEMIRGAYNVYLSGGYFAYYYGNTAWDLVKPDPEPPGMAPMQILKDNLSALPYWKMEPKPELALGGPCLATPGEVYACYVAPLPPRPAPPVSANAKGPPLQTRRPNPPLPRGGEIVLNLTGLKGSATLRWVNTWTGDHVDAGVDRPAVYTLRRPESFGMAPALLIVKSAQPG